MKSRVLIFAAVTVTAFIWYKFFREFERIRGAAPAASETQPRPRKRAAASSGFAGCSERTPESILGSYGRHWGPAVPGVTPQNGAEFTAAIRDRAAGHLACRAISERQDSLCTGYEAVGRTGPGYGSVSDLCQAWVRLLREAPTSQEYMDNVTASDCGRFKAGSLENRDCTFRFQTASAFLRRAPERCPTPLKDACAALLNAGSRPSCAASAKALTAEYCLFCSLQGQNNPCFRDAAAK
ncbi:MAG: hypothetical protein WC728_08080 [Elusimicrobiota bacterium]